MNDLWQKPQDSVDGKVKDFGSFCLDRLGVCQGDRASQVPSPQHVCINELPLPILFAKDGVVEGLKNCFNCGAKHRIADCDAPYNKNCVTMNRTWHQDYCKGSRRQNFSDARFFADKGNGLDVKNAKLEAAQQEAKSVKPPALLKMHVDARSMPSVNVAERAHQESLSNVMPEEDEAGTYTVIIPGGIVGKFIGSKAANLLDMKQMSGVDDIQVGNKNTKNPRADRQVILIGNGKTIQRCCVLVDQFLEKHCGPPPQFHNNHHRQQQHNHHRQPPPNAFNQREGHSTFIPTHMNRGPPSLRHGQSQPGFDFYLQQHHPSMHRAQSTPSPRFFPERRSGPVEIDPHGRPVMPAALPGDVRDVRENSTPSQQTQHATAREGAPPPPPGPPPPHAKRRRLNSHQTPLHSAPPPPPPSSAPPPPPPPPPPRRRQDTVQDARDFVQNWHSYTPAPAATTPSYRNQQPTHQRF